VLVIIPGEYSIAPTFHSCLLPVLSDARNLRMHQCIAAITQHSHQEYWRFNLRTLWWTKASVCEAYERLATIWFRKLAVATLWFRTADWRANWRGFHGQENVSRGTHWQCYASDRGKVMGL